MEKLKKHKWKQTSNPCCKIGFGKQHMKMLHQAMVQANKHMSKLNLLNLMCWNQMHKSKAAQKCKCWTRAWQWKQNRLTAKSAGLNDQWHLLNLHVKGRQFGWIIWMRWPGTQTKRVARRRLPRNDQASAQSWTVTLKNFLMKLKRIRAYVCVQELVNYWIARTVQFAI